MALETPKNRRYLVKNIRVDGKVRSVYLGRVGEGAGERVGGDCVTVADLILEADHMLRERRARAKAEQEQWNSIIKIQKELNSQVEEALREMGIHRSNHGGLHRKRGK